MKNLHARSVFFVEDAERSLLYYTQALGFSLDWSHRKEGRQFVFQVSLMGFQLILNQTEHWTAGRAGHGRAFLGLDAEQSRELRRHIREKGIRTSGLHWGAPTLVIRDLDANELFIWLPEAERAGLGTAGAESARPE